MDSELISRTSGAIGIIERIEKLLRFQTQQSKEKIDDVNSDFTYLPDRLSTLKESLCKVQTWVESYMAELHTQFFDYLAISLECCSLLLERLEIRITDIKKVQNEETHDANELIAVLSFKEMGKLQFMLEQQLNSLDLLLESCNL
jgi:hypothetical protein